jgi:hypothetical protein
VAWTYTLSDPLSLKDQVRLYIGDTIGTPTSMQLLQDEEILAFLAQTDDNPLAAAVTAARSLAARFARYVDEVSGDLQRKYSQRFRQFSDLADKLAEDANDPLGMNPVPYGGGISIDDIQSKDCDADRYPDIFKIGETDSEDYDTPGRSSLS